MTSVTEEENPNSYGIDAVSTIEALRIINGEDREVAYAIERILTPIAQLIDAATERIRKGGRLIYVGSGTSGRLGVLDASEVPPTFGVEPGVVEGIIAGGKEALVRAVEEREDDPVAGAEDISRLRVRENDTVIGISASGNTPYTVGAVEFARKHGSLTACITSNPAGEINSSVKIPICAVVGPEVIAGSTRMKSGTAQKMILNMISTMVMVKLGYVKGNRMTNLSPGNLKLRQRSLRILVAESGMDESSGKELLDRAGGDLRTALVMFRSGADADSARAALTENAFVIERAVESIRSGSV